MKNIEKTKTLQKLLNREITPNECKKMLNIKSNVALLLMIKSNTEIKYQIRDKLNFKKIKTMSFPEILQFVKKQEKRGMKKEQILQELEYEWEGGIVRGFDYRYFVESIGSKPSKRFICVARYTDRYDD